MCVLRRMTKDQGNDRTMCERSITCCYSHLVSRSGRTHCDTCSSNSGFNSGRRRRQSRLIVTMQYLSAKMLYHPLAVLLFLASSVFRIAGACSSRSTPKPRPPSQSTRPNITFPTFECPKEYQTHYCLNNARCFTVKIENSVLYNCECTDGFTGPRCEFKDPDGSYLLNREKVMIETASIAGGVVVAILLIFIISIAIYVYVSRRRRKILSKSSETSRNETDTDRWSPFRARRSNPQSSDIQLERYPRPRDEESGEMSTCAELNASGSSSTHLSHQLQLLDPWIKMGSVDKR